MPVGARHQAAGHPAFFRLARAPPGTTCDYDDKLCNYDHHEYMLCNTSVVCGGGGGVVTIAPLPQHTGFAYFGGHTRAPSSTVARVRASVRAVCA